MEAGELEQSVRPVTRAVFHMMRFFLHAALSIATICNIDGARELVNRDNIADLFVERAHNDWQHLAKLLTKNEEETAVAALLVLRKLEQDTSDAPTLNTRDNRMEWEKKFQTVANQVIGDSPTLESALRDFFASTNTGENEAQRLEAECKETRDPDLVEPHELVWCLRQVYPFSPSHWLMV